VPWRSARACASVAFETSGSVAPRVEVWSRKSAPRTIAATQPARSHGLVVEGLSEETDYELRILVPGDRRPPAHRFRTLGVTAQDVRIERLVDSARIVWSTGVPVRAFVNYWPRGGDGRGAPPAIRQSRLPAGGPTSSHLAIVDGLDPGFAYTVVIGSVTAEMESARSPELTIPSAADRIAELVSIIRRFDERVMRGRLDDLAREKKAAEDARRISSPEYRKARRDSVLAGIGSYLSQLEQIGRAFCPLSASLFASPKVYLREKIRVYEFLCLAGHLERFCAIERIEFSSGLSGCARGPFVLSRASTLPPDAEVVRVPLPSTVRWMTFSPAAVDVTVFGNQERSTTSFSVARAAAVRRAELALEIKDLVPELHWEARINDSVDLTLGLPAGERGLIRRVTLHHAFDPALLVEGVNRLSLTIRPTPGTSCLTTPDIAGVELRLERSGRTP
jgi:hypothetical protein